jgi:hypothetical protein
VVRRVHATQPADLEQVMQAMALNQALPMEAMALNQVQRPVVRDKSMRMATIAAEMPRELIVLHRWH